MARPRQVKPPISAAVKRSGDARSSQMVSAIPLSETSAMVPISEEGIAERVPSRSQ